MCGIVGYSGNSVASTPVLEGLSRLEYRGYDSAGFSYQEMGELKIIKKEGKLENLKNEVEKLKPTSGIGIGHTRWATHGAVNDLNAHPHGNEQFSIVHNGIIENANALRDQLKGLDYKFISQTDSETFLVKLTDEFKKCNDVKQAILNAFKCIEGNSAFVIMHKESQHLYAIKRAAPLVCGHSSETGAVFVSSDPYALIGFANKIFFPGDEILCVCSADNKVQPIEFYDIEGKQSNNYKLQEKELTLDVAQKGTYEHFMLKEIFEQPELLNTLYTRYKTAEGSRALNNIVKNKPRLINLTACGTALHAGMVIKNFLEKHNNIRVLVDYASEFRYRNQMFGKDEAGLFISQSGETADTLACQELCKENGLQTYSIVNVEGSTLYRNCDENLLIHAGAEIGVASTKAFTQMAVVGYLLSQTLNGKFESEETKEELHNTANAIYEVLHKEELIQNIAKEIYNYKGFIFTGRGEEFPIALEGALKLKEIAYVHAEGYAAGELKHGPIALFDEQLVNVAIVTPDLYQKTFSNAQEVKARRGVMVIIGEEGNSELEDISDYFIGLNFNGVEKLRPLVINVVLQLLSYHIAKFKGTDIDKPRNLAKSVTVE